MKTNILFLFLMVSFGSGSILAQPPWQQHGKLEVSADGHYMQHNDGTPFLWIGDTGWGMIQQLTREEIDTYLDNRQKLGFTVIQTVAFWYPHGGGMEMGPHNAANAYGFRPFSGGEDSPDTSEPLTVSGGEPKLSKRLLGPSGLCCSGRKKKGDVPGFTTLLGQGLHYSSNGWSAAGI